MNDPKMVVIGGGTGSFTLLSELKNYTDNLTALVNMVDDGGSTGILRDELGVLPPGDVRQCLVALSNSGELRDLFNFRFDNGTFGGHSFGNLFLSAAEKVAGNFAEAVKISSRVLNITGRVVPLTLDDCKLVLDTGGGKITGEFAISEYDIASLGRPPKLSLKPKAALNPEAAQALTEADLIVIAPGNLYGSLVPALLVDGVKDALGSAGAPVVYVCNLVNKSHQTADFAVHDYVCELERFAGSGSVDYVLYNTDKPNKDQLAKYALEGEFPVRINAAELKKAVYTAIPGKFLSKDDLKRQEGDLIERSLIRHDAKAVVSALVELTKH